MVDNELMRIQASTLYVLTEQNRIIRVNEREQTDGPALFIGKTQESILTYFHRDLPTSLVEEIRENTVNSVNIVNLCRIIELFKRVKDIWIGPAYRFNPDHLQRADSNIVVIREANQHILHKHFPQMAGELEQRSPMVGCIVDGSAVSVCCCARKSDNAAEASLVTAPLFRGRGLAEKVIRSWAMEVSEQDLIPLYSTSWDNLNSQKVAHKLGLIQYGMDFSIWT